MLIGRNDPCPCGSGKKYKKCHGATDSEPAASAEVRRANALKARDVEIGDKILRFARAAYGPTWLHEVLDEADLLEDGGVGDAEMQFVIPWLLHLRTEEDGFSVGEQWRQRERRLQPDDHLLIDAYASTWVSIWEVTEVIPGTGAKLRDCLTREERFVYDVRSSSSMSLFDTVLAFIVTCDGVSFFGGLHRQPLPPRFAEAVVNAARKLCRVRTRAVAPERLRNPDLQLALLELWRTGIEDMLDRPPPRLQNTDGDPFILTHDDFALTAPRTEVAQRLATLPGVEGPNEDGRDSVFTVTKAGNAMHRSWDNTVIGRFILSDARLRVETNSTRRSNSLRSLIEAEMVGLVRFRLRREDSTADLVATAMASGPHAGPETEMPPEAIAAVRGFRERHLKDWLDQSVPALDGLTPRQAALRPRSRAKLDTLLKEIERSEARLPREERIDLEWLRPALGC